MKRDVTSILEDLYRIDPNFKTYEPELTKMVRELLASKPDTRFDQAFADNLRIRLMDVKQPVVSPYQSAASHLTFGSIVHLFDIRKVGFGIVGAFVALLVILPLVNNQMESGLSLDQVITHKGTQSFGSLQQTPGGFGATNEMSELGVTNNSSARSSALEDSSVFLKQPEGITAAPMAGGMGTPAIAPYRPEIIRYTYEGEAFTIDETEGRVFMRTRGIEAGRQMADALKNINFNLMDLSKFDNLETRIIELAENKDKGYAINVNFEEGVMYIMPNWQRWNQDMTTSSNESESMNTKVAKGIPDDAKLIQLANEFLSDHGIKTDVYADPIVDRRQIEMYAAGQGASTQSMILPYDLSQISVIYPLTLNDQAVYDESGTAYGLTVSINVAENRVSGVNNLTSQLYESAAYPLETNSQKIVEYVTGQQNYYPAQGVAIKNIRLGTPEKVLMKYLDYSVQGIGRELYVPALKFPVISQSATPYYQNNIVIPIVKDILESRSPTPGEIIPMPVPLMR